MTGSVVVTETGNAGTTDDMMNAIIEATAAIGVGRDRGRPIGTGSVIEEDHTHDRGAEKEATETGTEDAAMIDRIDHGQRIPTTHDIKFVIKGSLWSQALFGLHILEDFNGLYLCYISSWDWIFAAYSSS